MDDTPHRGGFRLVDLVVIVLLGLVLLGLFFPFAQRLRGADERDLCMLNLKQMGLAVHNYAGTYDSKLPSLCSAPMTQVIIEGKPVTVQNPQSIFFTLLPYIEQENMYKSGMSASVQAGAPSDTNTEPPSNHTWLGKHDKGQIYDAGFVKTYVCRGDLTASLKKPTDLGWVGSSYGANYQVFGNPTLGNLGTPLQQFRSVFNIGNIPDGTSNTIFFADRLARYPGEPGQFKDPDGKVQQAHTLWAWPAGSGTSPPTKYKKPVPQNAAMIAYGFPDKKDTGYGTVVFDKPQIDVAPKEGDYRLVQSGHSKAVFVGMGDGSARAVSAKVSQTTWQHALTPADGVPLGDDW
jgi:hypothetical protein